MAELAHVNRLGLLTALPMEPWMLPMPDLSKALFWLVDAVLSRLRAERPPPGHPTQPGRALAIARSRPAWSKRFVPP